MVEIDIINDEDDDWQDWFQQGSERVLRSLRGKPINDANNNKVNPASIAIKDRKSVLRSQPTEPNAAIKTDHELLSTRTLGEILSLNPLSMFLYVMTQKEPDFFVDQLTLTDDMERVLTYTRILVTVCELELPGFHHDLLCKVGACKQLLFHFESIAEKMFSKRFKTMWMDLERVDKILNYIQSLLLQAQRAGVLSEQGMQLLFKIWMDMKKHENPAIMERAVCVQFADQLEHLFSVDDDILAERIPADKLYPTYVEVLEWCQSNNNEVSSLPALAIKYDSVNKYINNQKSLLRQNFLMPLRELFQSLYKHKNITFLPDQQVAFENVEIKLNKNFADAQRHKLLFIDVLSSQRDGQSDDERNVAKRDRTMLESLKCSTLVCLATSYDFENLILATVSPTDKKMLRNGYIGIIIMRQYNIGNVFGQRFIMFESPSYFEPFEKAYNYLCNCNVLNFPMSQFIVHGETETEQPAYLRENQPPITYQDQKFVNKLKNLPLNESQRQAFRDSLTNNFNLIQGPPGTGKTHLSVQLLKTLIENAKSCLPIVLITYTNESLDKFLLKLSSMLTSKDGIVRFGCQTRLPEITKYNARADTSKHMINPRLKKLYWMVNLEFKQNFKKLQMIYKKFDKSDAAYQEIMATQRQVWNGQEKLNSIRTIFQHYLVRKKRVIAMTTTCASRMNFVFRFLKSKIVIFEEAAEILEAHILPCLTPYTEHVIMIGDHKQLKPFTSAYIMGASEDINISLFERLMRRRYKAFVLNIQYRMHHSIAELLTPKIYEELKSDEIVDSYPSVRNMSKNLFFLTHNENEVQCRGSLYNDWELRKIVVAVRYLLEVSNYSATDIVVLSPYAKQVERVKMIFSNIPNMSDIIVSTVDSFQGLEANIVFLSLVRSNKTGQIGFLKDENRICVALSRSRFGLYIIGNMDILAAKSPTWSDIHEKLLRQNAIGPEFPFEKNV